MKVLIAMLQGENYGTYTEPLHSLSQMATTIVVNDFNSIAIQVNEHAFRLLIVVTKEYAMPDAWKHEEHRVSIPIMIISSLEQINVQVIQTLIDAFHDKEESQEWPPLFKESLQFIENNLCEIDLSLEKVASCMYVSKCHYSRMFSKNIGIGFKEYIMQKRIHVAKTLLQKGEPVTDVCYSVGYGDLTHFGRVFKKMVGVNPSVYRSEKGRVLMEATG
jgi:YesN/AraC family two-component response regulator